MGSVYPLALLSPFPSVSPSAVPGYASALLSPFVAHRLVMLMSREHHDGTDRLAELLSNGSVTPVIAARFGFADVDQALERLESGRSGGKLVVEVAGRG